MFLPYFQRLLKAEILSRLWICQHGFAGFSPHVKDYDRIKNFLIEWDQDDFSKFQPPGLTIIEENALSFETRRTAGLSLNLQFFNFLNLTFLGEYHYLLFCSYADVEKRLVSHKGCMYY